MAVYNSMYNRNKRYYPNNRNIYHHNTNKIHSNVGTPPTNTNCDIPPITETSPCTDNFSNNNPSNEVSTQEDYINNSNNIINSLFGMFNSKSMPLDKDRLILLGLMYLLYKEDKSKENFKLLLALGYILI